MLKLIFIKFAPQPAYVVALFGVLLGACSTSTGVNVDEYNPRIELVKAQAKLLPPAGGSSPGDLATMEAGQPMKIHSLDVGAGSCHAIECPGPGNEHIVFDCGTVGPTNTSMR